MLAAAKAAIHCSERRFRKWAAWVTFRLVGVQQDLSFQAVTWRPESAIESDASPLHYLGMTGGMPFP